MARMLGIDDPLLVDASSDTIEFVAAVPPAAAAVHRIAGVMEHVTYAEVAPSADEADQAMVARDAIVDEIRRREALVTKAARYLDVRELWRRRESHARRSATSRPTPMVGV
jgi:hypothetical protein